MRATIINSKNVLFASRNERLIAKEQISALHFPKEEVLLTQFDRYQRDKDLEHAILLGNMYKFKVKIVFEDIEGEKEVSTTIWGSTDKAIILKGNVIVPIHRIKLIQY